MRATLVALLALGVSVAWGETYNSVSVEAIEAAVNKDPATALQLIDKQLNIVEKDITAVNRRDSGFSEKDKADQTQALESWQDYLTAMRKKAQDLFNASRRAQGLKAPPLVTGAGVTR